MFMCVYAYILKYTHMHTHTHTCIRRINVPYQRH